MKVQVCMKDPDTLGDAIDDTEGTPEARAAMREFASKFFVYGEYLCVELDDQAQTIRVVPASEWR